MKSNSINIIIGVLLVAFGCVFGIKAFGVDIDIFFDGWWAFFIIIPSAIGTTRRETRIPGIIGLGLGVLLFLSAQDIIHWWMFGRLFPAFIFTVIGIFMIMQTRDSSKGKEEFGNTEYKSHTGYQYSNETGNSSQETYNAILNGRSVNFANERFTGATIIAVLGNLQFNLRDAILGEEVVINASTVLGGIDIYVPGDVKIILQSTPILGGVNNQVRPSEAGREKFVPVIKINATCVLGGINIK